MRFAYSTDGVARRGPVTLRARDVLRLHTALEKTPELADALGLSGGGRERWWCLDGRRERQSSRVDERARGSARRRSSRAADRPRAPGGASARGRCPPRCMTPATSATDAVRVCAGRVAEQRAGRSLRAAPSSSSSANQQPSPCLTGIVSSCAGCAARRERRLGPLDRRAERHGRRTTATRSGAARPGAGRPRSAPGSRCRCRARGRRSRRSRHGAHHRRETGDRPAAKVVAVREPPGRTTAAVSARQLVRGVPDPRARRAPSSSSACCASRSSFEPGKTTTATGGPGSRVSLMRASSSIE